MHCPTCGLENDATTRSCVQCGTPLAPCPLCGHANSTRANFCEECGASLAPLPAASAERRQLTVMFCDLVGSTALSTRLDPEELRDVLREYQAVCADAIARFEGSIAQYLGDGLLVYFGVPQAHEDDARRAGHAALEIVRAVGALGGGAIPTPGLAVRVGIHTGPVVVGEMGAGKRLEQLAIGETPNIAARLQSSARPNTVVVSETTHRLLSGFFDCLCLGDFTFHGTAKPLRVYELVGESGRITRSRSAPDTRLARLVGRRQEFASLRGAWRDVRNGQRRANLLSGEAGIGKTRLVEALKEHIAKDGALLLEGCCSPYYQNRAFHAVTDLVGRWLGFSSSDAPLDRQRRIEQAVRQARLTDTAAVPLLAGLLSVPLDAEYPALELAPTQQRQRTLDLLLDIPRALALEQPVMLFVEDLHWVDPSTLEFLDRFLGQEGPARVLTILTCRPEANDHWRGKPLVKVLELGHLDVRQVEELVVQTTGGRALPDDVVRRIVHQTDGVPLFIEETTRAIVESGVLKDGGDDRYELIGPLPATMVATSLQGTLMARLDRLGAAKTVVQLGATIGREFSYELLQAVSQLEDATLEKELGRALSSGLLQQQGPLPRATFVFRHSLVQETAYQSLLRTTRQTHHQRIAAVLEERFPEVAAECPELLAHHHTGAGHVQQAIPCWQKAGGQSIARAAFAEAISALSIGLRLLETLPATSERDRQELPLQTALGMALQAHRGYAAPEVDHAYTRARALCQHAGDLAELVSVLRGQCVFYGVRAEYQTAIQISRQMLEIAQRDGTSRYTIEAHLPIGLYSLYLGEFVGSRSHLERGAALYEPGTTAVESFHYVGHSAAMCHSYLARTLWFMGCVDEAMRHSLEGLHLARTLSIPMTIAQAMGMHTMLLQMRREIRPALEWAQQTRAYAAEHGFPYWVSLCSILQACLIAEEGDVERGITQFRQGMERYLATGAKLGLSWFLAHLADMLARSGRIDEGFEALAQASAHVRATGECYYESEIERLQGELLLRRPGPDGRQQAATCFLNAREIARRQHAKSWELRAATSLARLWRDEGRGGDARASLAELCTTFTEGLDTPDLINARRLLDELVLGT